MIAKLNAPYIITTNYDLLIENALPRGKWSCYVRDSWKYSRGQDVGTVVFKMHGTLPFTSGSYIDMTRDRALDTVVISEDDYDECADDLSFRKKGIFWEALESTLLILGKAVSWEDLSFMRALRERSIRSKKPAYWLLPAPLSPTDELILKNLEITPILMELPTKGLNRDSLDDIYFFAYRETLQRIFQLRWVPRLGKKLEEHRAKLTTHPRVVAIGLAGQDSVGRSGQKRSEFPLAGRRNVGLENFDVYAGGSALTAVTICKALDGAKSEIRCALVSTVGDDAAGQRVRQDCNTYKVDDDAVAITKHATHLSTVVVHNCKYKDKKGTKVFRGQRIFFDVSQETKDIVDLDEHSFRQFKAMLSSNRDLRAVYLDKWHAFSPKAAKKDKRASPGFLSLRRNRKVLKEAVSNRNVDVIYETGGTGTDTLWVEKQMAPLVNVMTAAFPFFLKHICQLPVDHSPNNEAGITELLTKHKLLARRWVSIPGDWERRALRFVKKNARRKWLIVTLHHHGALALFLTGKRKRMRFFPPRGLRDTRHIQNTAGAGDTFRGALLFGLLRMDPRIKDTETNLARCTAFAVKCATERCKSFKMTAAMKRLQKEGVIWWRNTR